MPEKTPPPFGRVLVAQDGSAVGIVISRGGPRTNVFGFDGDGVPRARSEGGAAWLLTDADSRLVLRVAAQVALGLVEAHKEGEADAAARASPALCRSWFKAAEAKCGVDGRLILWEP